MISLSVHRDGDNVYLKEIAALVSFDINGSRAVVIRVGRSIYAAQHICSQSVGRYGVARQSRARERIRTVVSFRYASDIQRARQDKVRLNGGKRRNYHGAARFALFSLSFPFFGVGSFGYRRTRDIDGYLRAFGYSIVGKKFVREFARPDEVTANVQRTFERGKELSRIRCRREFYKTYYGVLGSIRSRYLTRVFIDDAHRISELSVFHGRQIESAFAVDIREVAVESYEHVCASRSSAAAYLLFVYRE